MSEKIKYLDYEGTAYLLNTVYEDIVSYSKNAETVASEYTDNKIIDLINDAPDTLNTLGKIANVISDNKNNVDSAIDTKANYTDLMVHVNDINNPHGVTKAQVGLSDVDNKSSSEIISEANAYTDTVVANLVDSAPEDLNTLNELATALKENEDVVDVLNKAVGNKADKTALSTVENNLTAHTANTSNPHSVTKTQIGLDNVENKSSADIRGELTKDNVTTALGYTPPTTNTTYSNATQSTAGLESAADKTKLDGIEAGANNYSLPEATSETLGGIKIGSNITNTDGTVSLTKENVTTALGYTPPTNGFKKYTTKFTYTERESAAPIGSCTIPSCNDGFLIVTSNYAQYLYLITCRSSIGISKIYGGSESAPSASRYNSNINISNIPYMGDMTGTLTVYSFS